MSLILSRVLPILFVASMATISQGGPFDLKLPNSVPEIKVPDPTKPVREAAERARREAEARAREAAKRARQESEARARQASDLARQQAEAARRAKEEVERRTQEAMKAADQARLEMIERVRRYFLPGAREYIAYLV